MFVTVTAPAKGALGSIRTLALVGGNAVLLGFVNRIDTVDPSVVLTPYRLIESSYSVAHVISRNGSATVNVFVCD